MPTSLNTSQSQPASDVCPLCGGIGWVSYDVPIGHPNFGKMFRCTCQFDELESRQVERLRRLSNMSHLERMTFDSFIPDGYGLNERQRKSLRLAFDRAVTFARKPQGWLLLRGGYGCGKTHLAAAIANECLSRGQPALFVNVPDLLDHLRATFGPNSEVSFDERFNEIRDAPVLILDDLGTQNATPWAQEKLYQIFNYRYNAQLPTVITTNQDLSDIDPRLRSRLLHIEFVDQIKILAPDFRGTGVVQAQPGAELSTLQFHSDQTFGSFRLRADELPADESENLSHALILAQDYAAEMHEFKQKYPSPIVLGPISIHDPDNISVAPPPPRKPSWLILTGTYGCGKTHLAAAIANYLQERGNQVLFVVVPDLLDHLRAAFSPQSTVSYDRRFDEVRRVDFLVLDDLGTENATPWAREKLYQIINHRYAAGLPTVITTSWTIRDLQELEPRLAVRILDPTRCTRFGIIAPSYRIKKQSSESEKTTTYRRKSAAPRRER